LINWSVFVIIQQNKIFNKEGGEIFEYTVIGFMALILFLCLISKSNEKQGGVNKMASVNRKLAENINRFFTIVNNNMTLYKAVERTNVDITAHYKTHKSLENLEKIRGIGPKILTAMELVLEYGIDKAVFIALDKKTEEIRKNAFKDIPHSRDCDPETIRESFDDGEGLSYNQIEGFY
jgi:hypothetical protein